MMDNTQLACLWCDILICFLIQLVYIWLNHHSNGLRMILTKYIYVFLRNFHDPFSTFFFKLCKQGIVEEDPEFTFGEWMGNFLGAYSGHSVLRFFASHMTNIFLKNTFFACFRGF